MHGHVQIMCRVMRLGSGRLDVGDVQSDATRE